jgi:hypothetical protein
MPKKKAKEPIYLTPFEKAVLLGEVKLYHASMAVNMDCAGAIGQGYQRLLQGRIYLRLERRGAIGHIRVRRGTYKISCCAAPEKLKL